MKPLTDLPKKGNKFIWGPKEQADFLKVKSILSNPPLLKHFDPDKPTYLYVDASLAGAGGCIIQEDKEGRRFPVAYASRKLTNFESNQSTIFRELVGTVFCLQHFRSYLYGMNFVLLTDHDSLRFFKQMRSTSSRVNRMIFVIEEFSPIVKHVKGTKNGVADFLSRTATEDVTDIQVEQQMDIPIYNIELSDVKQLQREDDTVRKIIEAIEEPEHAENKYVKWSRRYKLKDGTLYFKDFSGQIRRELLVIPKQLKKEVMKEMHENIC